MGGEAGMNKRMHKAGEGKGGRPRAAVAACLSATTATRWNSTTYLLQSQAVWQESVVLLLPFLGRLCLVSPRNRGMLAW